MNSILIRFGEIGVKGKNRSFFEKVLYRNIRRALTRVGPFAMSREFGRIYAHPQEEGLMERAKAELACVFGIASFSPAVVVDAEPETIRRTVADWMETQVMHKFAPTDRPRFKVDVRRADKSYPATTLDMCRDLGGMIFERWPQLVIDLHHPEVKLRIEIRAGRAWIFHELCPSPGGVAVGSAGRVCLMLSGGIDSPVAGWMMMRRGVRMDAVYLHSPPFTSHRSLEKVLSLARVLSRWHLAPIRVHAISIAEIQKDIVHACDERLRVLLYKRFMTRVAQVVAVKAEALALVTGDSLGQVASQTLENLAVVEDVATMPVLRPLISVDKQEITTMAQNIGTYEYSILPFPDCCSLFLPRSPKTKAKLSEILEAEAKLDVDRLVAEAVAGAVIHQPSWDELPPDEESGPDPDDEDASDSTDASGHATLNPE